MKKMLVAARDVECLPKQWCVLKPDATNTKDFNATKKYACDGSDCTAIGNRSSCSSLDKSGKASYVFNMYHQAQNQTKGSCNFGGLATITDKNPSRGNCSFMVQIVTPAPPASAPDGSPDSLGSDSASGTSTLLVSVLTSDALGSLFWSESYMYKSEHGFTC